jgi:hypothetical protein
MELTVAAFQGFLVVVAFPLSTLFAHTLIGGVLQRIRLTMVGLMAPFGLAFCIMQVILHPEASVPSQADIRFVACVIENLILRIVERILKISLNLW